MRGDVHRKRQSPFPSYWYCLNKQTTTKISGWKESSTPELCAYSLVREKSLPEYCDPRTLWPRAEGPLCHIGVCHIPWSGFYWFIGLDLICGKTDSPLTTHKLPPLLSWNLKTYSAILPTTTTSQKAHRGECPSSRGTNNQSFDWCLCQIRLYISND